MGSSFQQDQLWEGSAHGYQREQKMLRLVLLYGMQFCGSLWNGCTPGTPWDLLEMEKISDIEDEMGTPGTPNAQ